MRQNKREIRDFDQITEVLSRCDTIRLGINDSPFPYVVPLSFGYETRDGKILLYIHGAKEGLKHDLLAKDNHVCVEADICHRFADTGHSVTTIYESVIGFGQAEKVFGEEAMLGLKLLLEHCGFPDYPICEPKMLEVMTVYRITLDSVTGKKREL